MRNAFAQEVTKLGQENDRVVLLSGDIGNRLFDDFKEAQGDRFHNCGIAEANMMSVAAGLGMSGFRPIVYTITPFTTTRCYEQIRVDVCYHESPVIIVGTGSGLSYAQLGPTHHSVEDIAILRALPGMTVFCPCDVHEVRAGLKAALKQDGPVYFRLGKKGEPDIHKTEPVIEFGKSITVREGDDVCIISTGNVVQLALDAAEELEGKGVSARVESFHTVKPLDENCLRDAFASYKTVAVVEEHSEIGGLYGAVTEWRAQQEAMPAKLVAVNLDDRFYHRVGSQAQVREHGGVTKEALVQKILGN